MVSVLARKLKTFLPSSPDDVKCPSELQFPPCNVERGKQFVHGACEPNAR
jgi:hypothetical protein